MSIPRLSEKKKKALNGKPCWSTISKSGAPRKSNPKRIAKRKAGYRKMLSGKEYKAARKEAFARAEGRCELTRWDAEGFDGEWNTRCGETENLHAHHLRYPKTRPLASTDLLIVCKRHHEMLEAAKMHKTRMF